MNLNLNKILRIEEMKEENIIVVRDDIEVGFGNVIPLWLFGFLY